ncbi:MAG: hypothetical protein DMF90_21695 [Acidobacteria bacterium]|nr:MAG: hypothetical protein DMF90_21695 [Acidobacteriota bacterium]
MRGMSVASSPRPMMFDMDEIILPTPAPPFAWRATAWGPALICAPIERIAGHVFTTRQWALGQPRTKESGWQDVAAAMQVDPSRVVRAEQVHGCGVLVGDSAMPPSSRADIIVVRDPTKAAAVRAADCAPLVIVDTGTGAVAAAHAGWRGMALRVPAVAVEAIVRTGGSRPADLLVAIGPSIGACCYEVGPESGVGSLIGRQATPAIRRGGAWRPPPGLDTGISTGGPP